MKIKYCRKHHWSPWEWTFIGAWKGGNRHGYRRVCLMPFCGRYQEAVQLIPSEGVRTKDKKPDSQECRHVKQPPMSEMEIRERLDHMERRHLCYGCGQRIFSQYWMAWTLAHNSQKAKA